MKTAATTLKTKTHVISRLLLRDFFTLAVVAVQKANQSESHFWRAALPLESSKKFFHLAPRMDFHKV